MTRTHPEPVDATAYARIEAMFSSLVGTSRDLVAIQKRVAAPGPAKLDTTGAA